jgi:hypothetical protein
LVISEGSINGDPRVSGFLNTPILTDEIVMSHFKAKLTPITLYSETIPGNPLGGPFVVRYLLNYVGALNGPKSLDPSDFLVAFSENIKHETLSNFGQRDIIKLFLPPVDPREFKFTTERKPGTTAIYNGKYKVFGSGDLGFESLDALLIEREGKNAPSRNELKDILSSVEALLSFENSSIVTEAILSGTVGVFCPNKFLTEVIAEKELGWDGTLWGWNSEDLPRAKKTLKKARENYILQIDKFFEDLEIFISFTQTCVSKVTYTEAMKIPRLKHLINRHRLQLALQTYQSAGLAALFRRTLDFLKRRATFLKNSEDDPSQGREILDFKLE